MFRRSERAARGHLIWFPRWSESHIDSFVAKVWRNIRGQYQFKTAEVTSDSCAAMFFGGIDLYSVHWVHEANRNLASSRCYSDFTIVHHSRFCEANRNMIPGSPARAKIRDVTQWSLYKSIPPKNMAASKSDVTSAVLNWYWPWTFLHTFATKLSP